MTQYEISAVLTTIITAIIAGFVLLRGWNKPLTKYYGIYTALISSWSFCWFKMISASNYSQALFWARFLHFPSSIIPATFLTFSQYLVGVEKEPRHVLLRRIFYGLGVFFLSISFVSNFVAGTVSKKGFAYYLDPGPLYISFTICFVVSVVIIHYQLFKAYRKEIGFKKMQIAYVLSAYAIGYAGGASVFLTVYNVSMPFFSLYAIPICHMMIAYTIFQYKLMDFGLIVRWGIAYGFLVSCLAGLLLAVLFVTEKISRLYFGGIPGIPTLVATAVIVASYEPLRKWTRKFVDRILFNAPDLQTVLDGFSRALHGARSLSQTIDNLSQELKKVWRVDHAGIALWSLETGAFSPLPHEAFQDRAIQALGGRIERSDFLTKTLENERRLFKEGVITQDEVTALANRSRLGERATLWKIRRTMRQVGAGLCAPIMDGKNLIGFIILSQKTDRTIFNDEDKKILSRVGELISGDLRNFISSNTKETGWSLTKLSQISTAG